MHRTIVNAFDKADHADTNVIKKKSLVKKIVV